MSKSLTRSEFIKGAILGTAGVVGLGALNGCTPSEASGESKEKGAEVTAEEKLSLDDAQFDVDVVVIGSGAGGMSAAIEAADQGCSVLLIEASAGLGGTTQFAEGILGVNTPQQQALGVENSIAQLVNDEMLFSNYAADARLIKSFLEGADENIQWLVDMNVEFYPDVIGGTTQHMYVNQGKQMIEKMQIRAEELDVTVLTSTRGKRLFLGDNTVTGVVAEGNSGEFPIKTKAVIMACGGYIQNEEMMAEMLRFSPSRVKVTAAPNHLGDSITMMRQAGGDQSSITLLHFIWCGLQSFDLHSELSTAACNEPFFFVDEKGRRFTDESLVLQPSVLCNAVLNQKRAFSILSQSEVDRLMSEGCTVGWGSYIFSGTQLTDLQNQLDEAVSSSPEGFFYGESIEQLAKEMEVESAVLENSIKSYNALCKGGEDSDFFKPAPFLREVSEEGPFYAFELLCNAFCTMGGIRVNQQSEVLDENFNAIPGLYCAGVDCGGLQGTTYCLYLGGGAQGYAVYSGRNSAQNAAKYLA